MVNTKGKYKSENKKKTVRSKKKYKKSKLSLWMKSLFTGEFLFPKNFSRSPLIFIIYCCCLLMIYLMMKYEPVKRYNKICDLNRIILEKNARNNKLKSEIIYMGSADFLMNDFEFKNEIDVFKQPIIIQVEE